MTPLKRKLFLAFFLLVTPAMVPLISAQQTYTQPMYPINWTSSIILVSVPTSLGGVPQAFKQAMEWWNQAQTWFLASYELNHTNARYTLQLAEAGQLAQVSVQYVSDTGQIWSGLTTKNGRLISIVISRFGPNQMPSFALEVLAEHELGHVLGLQDNCLVNDLMRGGCGGFLFGIANNYPSTLNLYGVYLQAVSGDRYGINDSITLPPQLPYSIWKPNEAPIPEFPDSYFPLVMASLMFVLIRTRIDDVRSTQAQRKEGRRRR